MHLEDPDNDDTVFYVLLRAVERFHSEYNRYPGYYDDHIEADIPKLKVSQNILSYEDSLTNFSKK